MTCILGQGDDIAGSQIGKTAVDHSLADAKGTGNSNQNVPGNELCVLAGIKHLHPCHHHRSDTGEKEHVQSDTRNILLDKGHFAKGGTKNHQYKEHQSKIFLVVSHRGQRIAHPVYHPENTAFTPSGKECIIGIHNEGVFLGEPNVHPVALQRGTASSDGTDMRSIVAIKVKLVQRLSKSGETGTEHHFQTHHARLLVTFLCLLLTFSGIRKQTGTNKNQI